MKKLYLLLYFNSFGVSRLESIACLKMWKIYFRIQYYYAVSYCSVCFLKIRGILFWGLNGLLGLCFLKKCRRG